MTDDQDQFLLKKFHANGLLVMGLMGGFAFTALVLVLTQSGLFDDALTKNLLTPLGASTAIPWAEIYFISLVVLLGTLSFWYVVVSFMMLIVSSVTPILRLRNLSEIAGGSVSFLSGFFGVVIWLLILPFSPIDSFIFFIVSQVLFHFADSAYKKDESLLKNDDMT